MEVTLQRTAYSTNIKTRKDFTCAVFDADFNLVAQPQAPHHIGSLVSSVPRNMKPLVDELETGDGVLVNDPYRGGTHLPDITLISPIFHREEIVGYAANIAHHVDIGGAIAGSLPTDETEIYPEGLIIPGTKAVENWEYDDNIMDLILRNVRAPEKREGDYHAQLGTNRIGTERYLELLEEYGRESFEARLGELVDYTEELVRAAIEELPDGRYEAEDYLDGDGVVNEPVKLALAVVIEDDEIKVDFEGTADQNKGPLNAPEAITLAGCLPVIMSFLGGGELPKNEGFYRPFSMHLPEGSMVNPGENAPIVGCMEVGMRISDLITKAMAEVMPDRTIASSKGVACIVTYGGMDPRDDQFKVFMESLAGGYGARPTKDGLEAVQPHAQNTANSPIEELETEVPVYVRRYELRQDSQGPGRYRGGMGLRRDLEFYAPETEFSVLSDRKESQPWGLFGGGSASSARYVINPESDDPDILDSKDNVTLGQNDIASVQTPGGGGYGPPLQRDPESVLRDVIDGKVSEERAYEVYGVVLDLERRAVDWEKTEERREELEQAEAATGGGGK
jgi:N-methylhydantoinase B